MLSGQMNNNLNVKSRLFLLAEINNFTSDELQQYQKSLENMGEFENIINSTEERAREAGRVEGLAEGRVEGRAEGLTEGGHNKAKEIAANMLSAGMSIEQVAQFTGLEISEVEKLSL